MSRFALRSRALLFAACCVLVACDRTPLAVDDEFVFAVFDVGQGLAQAAVRRGNAVLFDVGPQSGYAGWREGYGLLGRPRIALIVVSHTDEDHRGGLALLDSGVAWNGQLAVSPYEDTTLLRDSAGAWSARVRFRTVAAGDTLAGLEGVTIECLWPPRDLDRPAVLPADERNRRSLVLRISFGGTSALVTSDIDTLAERSLCALQGAGLSSDMVVVPHHGSAGSVDASFYGYVHPGQAVISCARYNDYGQPSAVLYDVLFDQHIAARETFTEGHIVACSNGYYWDWQAAPKR
jgi:competence protein ComEC